VAGNADNALSDIEIFMHVPVRSLKSSQEEDDKVEWEVDEGDE